MEQANKRIFLSTPTMHEEEMGFIREAFHRNWIAPLGFNCDLFESEMSEYLAGEGEKALFALSLASGTSALHLGMKLAGVKRGDEVLCSDMTFSATVNPVVYEGGVPVFVDSERESWNMDPDALEEAFLRHPKARVVVLAHLYGTPAKMDRITEICHRHGATLIEDAAEALSAEYKGKRLGTFGDYGVLSFNGNKLITTSGGGMLLCKTKEARDKAFFWATQSRDPAPWYQHSEIGYNYRLSNVLAGIGRGQLLHVEEHRAKKEEIYHRYEEGLEAVPVKMNPILPEGRANYWLSCMTVDEGVNVDPLAVMERLAKENIETRPIWKPMHLQPVFSQCDFVSVADAPVNEDIFRRGLCLPSDIKMTPAEQDRVIAIVKSLF